MAKFWIDMTADDIPNELWGQAARQWMGNLGTYIQNGAIDLIDDTAGGEKSIPILVALASGIECSDPDDEREREQWRITRQALLDAGQLIDSYLS